MQHTWRSAITQVGVAAVLATWSGLVAATPVNGFGAYGGIAAATEAGHSSRGLSLGGDAQFVINESWSLNPYVMMSAEKADHARKESDGLAGLHLRRWLGDWFVGGQIFYHTRVFFSNGSAQNSTYGPGLGAVGGYECANGWGVEAQLDALEGQFFNAGSRREALRLHLTYRWH